MITHMIHHHEWTTQIEESRNQRVGVGEGVLVLMLVLRTRTRICVYFRRVVYPIMCADCAREHNATFTLHPHPPLPQTS